MKKTFIAIAICTLFTSGASAANDSMKNMVAESKMASNVSKSAKPVMVIDVVNEEINGKKRYSPSVFIVKLGQKVQFKIFNALDMQHGFSIDAFKVKGDLGPKKDNIIEFTPNKLGLFQVYCQYHPGHLKGQLLVVK